MCKQTATISALADLRGHPVPSSWGARMERHYEEGTLQTLGSCLPFSFLFFLFFSFPVFVFASLHFLLSDQQSNHQEHGCSPVSRPLDSSEGFGEGKLRSAEAVGVGTFGRRQGARGRHSVKRPTWSGRRQLQPQRCKPGSTKSSRHLERISGDTGGRAGAPGYLCTSRCKLKSKTDIKDIFI